MNYAKLAATALRLIAANGQDIPVLRASRVFDDISGKPADVQPDPVTWNYKAVVLPAKADKVADFDIKIEDDLKLCDVRFLIAAAKDAAQPAPLDELTIGGAQYVVRGFVPLAPAGVALVYRIGVVKK